VVVHVEDSLSPEQYEKEDQTPRHAATCQFCPGREHQTPREVDAIRPVGSPPNSSGWQARVVPNKFPALKIEGNFDLRKQGIFDSANGIGAHEVLIESPSHEKNLADFTREEVAGVVKLYQRRLRDLTGDRRFKYIIIFKNSGESAGTSVEHAHSQIIALPMIPQYVFEELEGVKAYYQWNQRCVFCDIIEQEHKDQSRVISENDDFIAFCPFVSRYSFEYWILPKYHLSNFADLDERGRYTLADILRETLARLKNCLSNPSYNYYLHVAPVNAEKNEDFHWHIEVVPKLTRTSGFEWGTGFDVASTSPEAAAGYLRNVSCVSRA
jgi:UDPglucose--hexose-1-phosphate uridylyltransferase